jgi:hypothetical protein
MNTPIRSALLIATVLLLAVGILGIRFVGDPADLRMLLQAERRHQQLQRFKQVVDHRIEAKDALVREVIAQRCKLSEALTRCQEIDREWLLELERDWPNAFIGEAEMHRVACSDADCYFHSISWRVEYLLRNRPREAAIILHRLEKEYQQLQTSQQATLTPPMEQAGTSR